LLFLAIFIPEDKILEIKNAADIVDMISEVVHLKKTGKNFVGLCPFHAEKTPSFSVSPEKQIFYCFGCGAGGNIFSFLMKNDGLAFPEAARSLARRYGIDIPSRSLTPEQKKTDG
jgi:DNA primase